MSTLLEIYKITKETLYLKEDMQVSTHTAKLGIYLRHPNAVLMQPAWILLNLLKWEVAANQKKEPPNSSLDLVMDL